jgi:1,2-dihydroxy-3-keto-5-methylthiopentene dioxygenase
VKGDQRQPHNSGRGVEQAYLEQLGVKHYVFESIDGVDQLAAARGYKNRDQVTISPEAMGPIFEDKVKSFFHEHIHEDEEIRYIRDGQGYFDVRSRDDAWVRIKVEKVSL